MILLDNRLVDQWWEDVLPRITRLNYSHSGLTPELLKSKLLHGLVMLFDMGDLLIFGYLGYDECKYFYIVHAEGKNFKSGLRELSKWCKKHGCFSIRGHSTEVLAKTVYTKAAQSISGYSLVQSDYYEVDLNNFEADYDRGATALPNAMIDLWWQDIDTSKLEFKDYIKQMLISGELTAYKVGSLIVFGRVLVSDSCKNFNIIALSGANYKEGLHSFCSFVESQMYCRFVTIRCNCHNEIEIQEVLKGHNIKRLVFTKFYY